VFGAWLKFITFLLTLTLLAYVAVTYFDEFAVCGLHRSYAPGTIVALRRDVAAEKDLHGRTEPEFKLAWRPVIKLEDEGSREVVAAAEWAPIKRKIGDRVQVCFSRQTPELVFIMH
jgi:hypothetical protein